MTIHVMVDNKTEIVGTVIWPVTEEIPLGCVVRRVDDKLMRGPISATTVAEVTPGLDAKYQQRIQAIFDLPAPVTEDAVYNLESDARLTRSDLFD